MPSGRKSKNKQRKRRKHHKQLLEKSRRSRDEEVNSILEKTDVIAHLPRNGSFHQISTSTTRTLEFDMFDGLLGEDDMILPDCIFGSPSKTLSSSCFSTPKRNIGYVELDVKKSKRSLSSPSTVASVFLSPISSKSEDEPWTALDDGSLVITSSIKLAAIESSIWLRLIKYTQHLLTTVPNFFSKICSWVKFMLTTVGNASYSVIKTDSIELNKHSSTRETIDTVIKENSSVNNDVFMEKLNTILAVVTRLEEKHDLLLAKVTGLEQCVERLKVQPATSASLPPPPPPLPPPLPLACAITTPLASLEKRPARKSVLNEATPRPSITLQDILSVQLKKTPAPRPIDKTSQLNGSRGPLVSVDMLRAVKLKPSQLRRRSIERPLQSPSAVFKIRSP